MAESRADAPTIGPNLVANGDGQTLEGELPASWKPSVRADAGADTDVVFSSTPIAGGRAL